MLVCPLGSSRVTVTEENKRGNARFQPAQSEEWKKGCCDSWAGNRQLLREDGTELCLFLRVEVWPFF